MQKVLGKKGKLLSEAKEKHGLMLISKRNVIALGIGLRTRGGKVVAEPVVKVYVSRKIPKHQLAKTDLIPPTLDVEGKKVKTDVEEAEVPRFQVFTRRCRPLVGGSSIGPGTKAITGTLGICVTMYGDTYILSNNHVLAGTGGQAPMGTPIIQPGQADGGSAPDDIVATLYRSVPFDFGRTTVEIDGEETPARIPNPNYVDCALAKVLGQFNIANREIHWIGYPAFHKLKGGKLQLGRRPIYPGDAYEAARPVQDDIWLKYSPSWLIDRLVHKMGRTTGYTIGTVIDADWEGWVIDTMGSPPMLWFQNQIKIEAGSRPFTSSGDSGSLVLDAESNLPVGLLFAGTSSWSIANHIDSVMLNLDIPTI